MHAEVLRERGCFHEVRCAFLKEEPRIEHVLAGIDSDHITIVPDFLAEGYFTRQVIPDLLNLDSLPETIRYCDPVGVHPWMSELILETAQEVMGDWVPEDVSLLVVGHGSKQNTQSKKSLLNHLAVLRESASFIQIADLWLEEPPFVSDWQTVATQQKIIVVPFLLSDGQHGGWDIPEALGVGGSDGLGAIYGATHHLGGIRLRLTRALGSLPKFAEVILNCCQVPSK